MLSCGVLETPRNGRKSNFLFTPGVSVFLECDYGYSLVGDRRRECGEDAKWNLLVHGAAKCLKEDDEMDIKIHY